MKRILKSVRISSLIALAAFTFFVSFHTTNAIFISTEHIIEYTVDAVPPPTNLTASCSADGKTGTFSWTAPSGYNTFYTRASIGGVMLGAPATDENFVGTTKTFTTTPGSTYEVWVHTKDTSTSAWSTEIRTSFACAASKPDLTAGSTTGPATATVGTSVTYSSSISNIGDGATPAGFENILQILDSSGNNLADTLSTTPSPMGALAAGASTTATRSFPFSVSGTYQVRFCADYNVSYVTAIGESNENNNCGGTVTVTVAPPPPTNLTASCSADGKTGTFSWTAPSGYNTFYTRASIGGVMLGAPATDENFVGTTKTFTTTPGSTYEVWVHTKNTSTGSWSPEVRRTFSCANPLPDLTAGSTTGPATATVGTSVTYSASISNIGDGATPAGFNNIFQVIDTSWNLISTHSTTPSPMGALAAGASATSTRSHAFTTSGTYYVRFCSDFSAPSYSTAIGESNENNNCGVHLTVTVADPLPNLIVSAPTPSTVTIGSPATFSATVTNQGAGSTKIGFSNMIQVRHNDATWSWVTNAGQNPRDASSTRVLSGNGDNASISGSFTFPQPGNYVVGFCVDANSSWQTQVTETDDSWENNCNWTAVTVNPPPPPSNITSSCSADGKTGTFSWTAPAGYNTFYTRASTGGTDLGPPAWDDNFVGTTKTFTTNPGSTYNVWIHTKDTSTGAWSNNLSSSFTCNSQPDLTVGSLTGSAIATVGTSVTYSAPVNNIGNGSTGSGFNNILQILDSTGNTVVSVTNTTPSPMPALGAGTSGTASQSHTFTAAGTYLVRICADFSAPSYNTAITESNDDNNCGATKTVTVNPPPPDLSATATSPITATAGVPTTISGTVTNIGAGSTGQSFENLFSVHDSAWGYINSYDANPSPMNVLAAGASAPISGTHTFTSPGSYITQLCANLSNTTWGYSITNEPNYSNNCALVNVTVSAPDLPDLVAGSISPTTAIRGNSINFTSVITNQGTKNTGGSFNNFFQVATSIDSNGAPTGTITELFATPVPMQPINISGTRTATSASHTFSSAGTYYVRACADKRFASDTANSIVELDENNNCSVTTAVTVTAPVSTPTVNLTANPTSGTAGGVDPKLTWTTTNSPTSCTASGDWSGSKAVGGGGPESQGTLNTIKTYFYTITCTNSAGTATDTATVVVSSGDGVCGTSRLSNQCTVGSYTDMADNTTTPAYSYLWTCTGSNSTPIQCSEPFPACSDGKDNEPDGLTDFGTGPTNDPGCTSATDNDEKNVKIKVIEQ